MPTKISVVLTHIFLMVLILLSLNAILLLLLLFREAKEKYDSLGQLLHMEKNNAAQYRFGFCDLYLILFECVV